MDNAAHNKGMPTVASRLLNEAAEAGMIVIRDPEAGTRNRTYLPYWAAPAPAREGIV